MAACWGCLKADFLEQGSELYVMQREKTAIFVCPGRGERTAHVRSARRGREFCRETSCRGEGRQQAYCRAGQTPSSGNLKVQTV